MTNRVTWPHQAFGCFWKADRGIVPTETKGHTLVWKQTDLPWTAEKKKNCISSCYRLKVIVENINDKVTKQKQKNLL